MLIAAVALLALQAVATPQAPERSLVQTDEPPQCPFVAEHYFFGSDALREIWLRPKTGQNKPVLLATYVRSADLIFSSDCSAIALNDYAGSDVAEVRVFRKHASFSYKQVPVDVTSAAWSALAKAAGLNAPPRLDHTYVAALEWSSDALALLLRVWGHTDIHDHVDNWYCVFDFQSQRVSTDLSAMNRNAIVVHDRQH